MRNIKSFNVTAPAYIGNGKNNRGQSIAEEANHVATININQFGYENSFATFKDALEVVASPEDIQKYGVIVVGAPE